VVSKIYTRKNLAKVTQAQEFLNVPRIRTSTIQ